MLRQVVHLPPDQRLIRPQLIRFHRGSRDHSARAGGRFRAVSGSNSGRPPAQAAATLAWSI